MISFVISKTPPPPPPFLTIAFTRPQSTVERIMEKYVSPNSSAPRILPLKKSKHTPVSFTHDQNTLFTYENELSLDSLEYLRRYALVNNRLPHHSDRIRPSLSQKDELPSSYVPSVQRSTNASGIPPWSQLRSRLEDEDRLDGVGNILSPKVGRKRLGTL